MTAELNVSVQTIDASRAETNSTQSIFDLSKRLRRRANALRLQALVGLFLLAFGAAGIAWLFVQLQRVGYSEVTSPQIREPYDYKTMESRHEAIAVRLKEMSSTLSDTRQELIVEKFGVGGRGFDLVRRNIEQRLKEIQDLRIDIEERIRKDRQNLVLEVQQLRSERDRAVSEGVEKRSFLRLLGDAVMRVGVLILAVYLISILANVIKYWLRVADHLQSIADSIELSSVAGISIANPIAALTPHSIDFPRRRCRPRFPL